MMHEMAAMSCVMHPGCWLNRRIKQEEGMMSAGTEYELELPPQDGITSLSFGNDSDSLLVSSWDGVPSNNPFL